MSRKIIHIVLGKANPNRMNGVNKVVDSLAHHQFLMEKDVEVWGITKITSHNYPLRLYKTKLFKDFKLKFLINNQLKRAILEQKVNYGENVIFHIHGGFLPQMFVIAKLLVAKGIDFAYTPHGAFNKIALQRSALKKKVYLNLLEEFIVKNAKFIQCIGISELMHSKEIFKHGTFKLIPNGQNLISIKESTGKTKENKEVIFGFVGRTDIQTKGLDLLLEAISSIKNNSKLNVKLWIVGDGSEQKKLINLIESFQLKENVILMGAQYGEDKNDLIKKMDYLCLTSRNEGLPGVVLEACSMGIPCIVSEETNMADYIKMNKAGLSVKENNSPEIARSLQAAIDLLLTNDYQKMKINSVNMIEKIFDWKIISSKLIMHYEIR